MSDVLLKSCLWATIIVSSVWSANLYGYPFGNSARQYFLINDVRRIYIHVASKIPGQQDNGHLVTKQIGPGAVPLDSSPIGEKMRH